MQKGYDLSHRMCRVDCQIRCYYHSEVKGMRASRFKYAQAMDISYSCGTPLESTNFNINGSKFIPLRATCAKYNHYPHSHQRGAHLRL